MFSALAIFLVWQVVAHSFAAYLAPIAPGAALWFDPQQPAALVDLADRALNAPKGSGGRGTGAVDQISKRLGHASDSRKDASGGTADYQQTLNRVFSAFETVGQNRSVSRPLLPANAPAIRAWAETALRNDPLNAHALRILGQLAEASDDDSHASKFMHAAAHLSLHDGFAIFWLLRKSAQARDYKSAIYYADILLRTRPELGGYAMPVLAQIAEDEKAVNLLKTVLAGNPPWRAPFFAALPQSVPDVRIPLELLSALRTSPTPPTPAEVGSYVNFLIGRKLYDLAYYTWLQFLPPHELRNAGLLFNGSFEVAPTGVPFDWRITQGSGVTIDIVPKPGSDGEHALLVDFQFGRVAYHSVTELVMLAPGVYAFEGEYKGKLDGPRGLTWRIACAGRAAAPVGESSMITGIAPHWRPISFTFTVSAVGCRAQYVRLDFDARMPSEQFASGSMFFDKLRILRLANPPS
jgi:hypothetical protein